MKKIRMSMILLFQAFLFLMTGIAVRAEEKAYDPVAVSFAIDVSGSMKKTDSDGLTVALLEMFMDSMSENDYVGVTLYNDMIVYDSSLVRIGDADAIENLKSELEAIRFSGDTDNGMGLLKATSKLADTEIQFGEKYVFLISDGDTDIPETSDRTIEDSNRDLNECAILAASHDMMIHAVEYTDKVLKDTTTLSVITSSSGGSTTLVSDQSQYIQVMMNLFYTSYHHGKSDVKASSEENLVFKQDFSFADPETYCYRAVVFSSEIIREKEFSDGVSEFSFGPHYVLIPQQANGKKDNSIIFSVENKSTIFSGIVSYPRLFEEEPRVEVKYVETQQEEKIEEKVVEPPKNYDHIIVYIIMGVIAVGTVIICILIIRRILFQNKNVSGISGYLELRFIDLKSRNESEDVKWDLSQYPAEGVTLKELFQGAGLKDEFKDLDKICFYPSTHSNELTLVHCMEGGVFKGEQLLKRNSSFPIRNNDVLFISFSENASEISITYHPI